MEKPKDKVLVFEDHWCQIWYNDDLKTVAVDNRNDGTTVVLSLKEWQEASSKISAVREKL